MYLFISHFAFRILPKLSKTFKNTVIKLNKNLSAHTSLIQMLHMYFIYHMPEFKATKKINIWTNDWNFKFILSNTTTIGYQNFLRHPKSVIQTINSILNHSILELLQQNHLINNKKSFNWSLVWLEPKRYTSSIFWFYGFEIYIFFQIKIEWMTSNFSRFIVYPFGLSL